MMKLVSILKDEIGGEVYGYAVKSGKSITYFGVNESSGEWAKWANSEAKSQDDFSLPFGVSGTEFEIPNRDLAQTLGISEADLKSTSQFNVKTKSVKHDIEKDFINVSDSPILGQGQQKTRSINFKALAFKNDQKLSSFITEFKSQKHAFDIDTNRFNSKSKGIERSVFHSELREKMSNGFERRLGNLIVDSREKLVLPIQRKSVGASFFDGMSKKDIGPKLGSGAARLGRRTLRATNARFDPDAIDADLDKIIQEGTPFERPDTSPKPVKRVVNNASQGAAGMASARDNAKPIKNTDPEGVIDDLLEQADGANDAITPLLKKAKYSISSLTRNEQNDLISNLQDEFNNGSLAGDRRLTDLIDYVKGTVPSDMPVVSRRKKPARGMQSQRVNRQANAVRAAVGGSKPKSTRTSSGPTLARFPGQRGPNGEMLPRREFEESTLQAVYDSFTKKPNENPAETYRRVAQEFTMSIYDVEAHINEMHKGSRLRLPFAIRPEYLGITPSEASAVPKPMQKLSDEQIYAARMTGVISLEDMAKILGMTRSEVRQAEQRHMRTLPKTPEITSTEARGMPSRRRSGSTMPGRARRLESSIARVQTVPNAKPEKGKKAVFGAGSKKVGPNDGRFVESLAPNDKDKATKAMQELETELTNTLKGGKKKPTKRNPNPSDSEFGTSYFAAWWRGQMRGAEKQTRRGGTFAPRNHDDKLTTSDITEMRLVLDAEIAAGRIDTVAIDKDGKPKVDKDGNPLLSPAEKAQRMLDDMQTLIEMRDSNSYEMVEHLHTESQKKVAEAVTGKTKMRGSEIKKLGLGEESSFWGRARGLDTGLSALTDEDKNLADTRQRFLRVNPERKRKRELKAARKSATRNRRGRQLTETSPELAIEQKKLRFMAAKRELAARLRRNRSASKLEEKVKGNKSDNHKMVTRNADGTFTVNPRFTSALAFVSREYAKDAGLGREAQRRQAISNLWENTGFSNEPVLISKDEVQDLIDAGWTPIVRGTGNEKVKGEAYVEQFLTNPDRFVPGQGGQVHGFGEYFTDKPESWNGYRGGRDDRHTILALIPPSATVVDKQTLKNEQQAMHKITETMMTAIQEMGGKDAAAQLTSGEIAAALRKGLAETHSSRSGTASYSIADSIISQLEEMDRSGKDSVKAKADAIEAISFLNKAAGTDEEGRFAPIIGVSLERSHSNVILLHDRSSIAAVHVPLEDEVAQKLAKGERKATKASKAQKKAQGVVDVTSWTKTGGQRGSNAGGTYRDGNGVEHYVKQPNSQIQAENEVLASRLYNLAGVKTPEINLGDENGSPRVVSKIMTDISPASSSQNDAIADTFVTHAWLGNWDALLNNNTQVDSSGNPVTIDAGGAILFRANAGRKGTGGSTAFGDVAGEMDTLRDPSVNPTAARVFGKLTPDQIKTQVARLRLITADQIRKTVDTMISDMVERKKIADTLIARQQDIINRFG